MNIKEYLLSPESPRLEFKEQLPSNDKLAALICSFANSLGGDLIIGIEDETHRLVGVQESEVLAI
jgi:predicted HTH transcriptional regulator